MKKLSINRTLILSLVISLVLSLIISIIPINNSYAATSNLILTSSSAYLTDAFNWAKTMALSKVKTGVGSNIPCYQAALQARNVFCQRDYAHQLDGAALLGLNDENYNMLMAYAQLQTQARDWYSIWEVNYDGSISPIDYVSDSQFWRNLAGMFEVAESGYRQYEWTGNSNLINNATLNNFYSKTVNEFVANHDENGNGIAEEHSSSGWVGVCSYNEGPDYTLKEAADGLGCQYKAYWAYAKILEAKGDTTGAATWTTKANNLKNTFNSSWYSTTDGRYVRGKNASDESDVTNFGYESSWFIPYKELSDVGTKAEDYLDFIYSSFMASPSPNIEAWTYLPDVFYKWNQNARAWSFLKSVMDSGSDYPEVSFTIISAIAKGMMGIQPNAPENKVITLPRLPAGDPSEVAMVDLNNIKIGTHNIEVKHEGNVKTTVTHNSGTGNLTWEAQMPGTYATLLVNGIATTATTKNINGTTVSCVTITLPVGSSAVVATGATSPQQLAQNEQVNLIQNPGFESGNDSWTFISGAGTATNRPYSGTALAYLDAGTSNKISQTISITDTGKYNLSGWVSASSTGGIFGIKVNGVIRASVNVPQNTSYNMQSINNIALNTNDSVEIFVTGATNGWVNVDDFKLARSPNYIQNPGFESGTTAWTFSSGTGRATNRPYSGIYLAYLDAGTSKKISQTITVSEAGSYDLSGMVSAGGAGGVFGIKVNGVVRASASIPSNTAYNKKTINAISLNSNDFVEVYVTGATSSWVNVDDFELIKS